jgi:hypothetical protein
MGGSIWWKDGRYYNLRYQYVYLKGEFEPLPCQNIIPRVGGLAKSES